MKLDIKTYQKEYREKNKEKQKENHKKWYENNKNEIRNYNRKYHDEHKEECDLRVIEYNKEHPEKQKEYHKRWSEKNSEKIKEYKKKWNEHPNHKIKNKECQIIRTRRYKIRTIEKIAEFHRSSVECWRCHESRLWCLTIGHINQDGKEDRTNNGSGTTFYKQIIDGNRACDDLKIECISCNYCLQWYGKYPDEITEKEFRL